MSVAYLPTSEPEFVGKQFGCVAPSPLERNNFDFVRWALAVLVIASHSFALLSGSDDTEPLMRWTGGQLTFGGLAVDWFFVISGFLITHSWLRSGDPLAFLRKRACRIIPGYIAAVLFCAFVVAPLASERLSDAFTGSQIAELCKGILTLRGYRYAQAFAANPYPRAINGSLWSISFECWCYVGVAALGLIGLLARKRLMLLLFLGAIVVSVVFLVLHLRLGGKWLGVVFGSPQSWARLLPYYLSGVVFYLFRERILWSRWLVGVASAALIAGCVIPNGLAVALPTAGTYLLLWFVFHPSIRLNHWAAHGDFSYGIYLYAFPLQQLLIQWLPGMHPLTLFVLATPLTMAFGFLSWHGVEKHSLQRRRRTRPGVCSGGRSWQLRAHSQAVAERDANQAETPARAMAAPMRTVDGGTR